MLYKKIIRPILFRFGPEKVHNFTIKLLSIIDKSHFLNNLFFKTKNFTSPRIKQKIWGLYWRTPIGLTAGMDKSATCPTAWSAFDFGWAQIGSVTHLAQPGNPKPRLWRLPQDNGLVVYYGLSNKGAQAVAHKLNKIKNKRGLLSISIAKTSKVAMTDAADDYAEAFKILEAHGNIITLNLSCPNVEDFSALQKRDTLEPILQKITKLNYNKKPIWLKISYDLSKQQLDDIISLAKQYNIAAIVATNLAKDKSNLNLKSKYKNKPGGVSGQVISEHANKVISYLYKNCENKFKIIGVGGIFSGQDAYDKIKAGASLLQIATGFIYNGPNSIKQINKQLDKLLQKNNFDHISKAVGIEADKYNL
jgi:dihydroorotate dehydrogenase